MAIKNTITFQLKDQISDPDGRYLIITGDFNNLPMTFVSLYAPNTHQLRFLRRLFKTIAKIKYGNLVICGDFNLTVNPDMDISSSPSGRRTSLLDLLHKEQLFDAWRCFHASKRDFTFYSARHRTYSRIDLFLVDWHLLGRNSSTAIKNITWSDHAAIEMTVDEGIPRGSGMEMQH